MITRWLAISNDKQKSGLSQLLHVHQIWAFNAFRKLWYIELPRCCHGNLFYSKKNQCLIHCWNIFLDNSINTLNLKFHILEFSFISSFMILRHGTWCFDKYSKDSGIRTHKFVCKPGLVFNRYSWYGHYAMEGIGRNMWKVGKIDHS